MLTSVSEDPRRTPNYKTLTLTLANCIRKKNRQEMITDRRTDRETDGQHRRVKPA